MAPGGLQEGGQIRQLPHECSFQTIVKRSTNLEARRVVQVAYDYQLARFYMWAQTEYHVFVAIHVPTGAGFHCCKQGVTSSLFYTISAGSCRDTALFSTLWLGGTPTEDDKQ